MKTAFPSRLGKWLAFPPPPSPRYLIETYLRLCLDTCPMGFILDVTRVGWSVGLFGSNKVNARAPFPENVWGGPKAFTLYLNRLLISAHSYSRFPPEYRMPTPCTLQGRKTQYDTLQRTVPITNVRIIVLPRKYRKERIQSVLRFSPNKIRKHDP